jgi:hypothetical protein
MIELFARREPDYAAADVVRLVGVSEDNLAAAIIAGDVATQPNDMGQERIPWEEVAILALEEVTPRMIEAALEHQPDEVIPYLNQHRLICVSLPIYLVRLLDYLAREDSTRHRLPRNVSDAIERILVDFATTQDIRAIDVEVPGLSQALEYPYFTPPRYGAVRRRCRYCGVAITTYLLEVCRTCQARHEPKEHLCEHGLPELDT